MGQEMCFRRSVRSTVREVVHPDDVDQVMHFVTDDRGAAVRERVATLPASLDDLGVQVSTGRVVDFRVREHLRDAPAGTSAPLIYPLHLEAGRIRWPRVGARKPNATLSNAATSTLLMPAVHYVLTRRFSAREKRRRIVATVFDPGEVACERVGFENHLNVFHAEGRGLSASLAHGLAAWLNSTLADQHFRAWSGHPQLDATDLRAMRYPTRVQLETLGASVVPGAMQDTVDAAVKRIVFSMAKKTSTPDPMTSKKKVDEAIMMLKTLGVPREQQTERAALTLLALADWRPGSAWRDVATPLLGITQMMEFFERAYGKRYAPNSRETVRRFTVQQFVEAGITVANPDRPARATNSPKAVYQLESGVAALVRTFGTNG
jgi:adenine-specific DNA-methyltransferase